MSTGATPPLVSGAVAQIKEHLAFVENDSKERNRLIAEIEETVNALLQTDTNDNKTSSQVIARAEQALSALRNHLHPNVTNNVIYRAEQAGWSLKAYTQVLAQIEKDKQNEKSEARRKALEQMAEDKAERQEYERFLQLRQKYGKDGDLTFVASTSTFTDEMHF